MNEYQIIKMPTDKLTECKHQFRTTSFTSVEFEQKKTLKIHFTGKRKKRRRKTKQQSKIKVKKITSRSHVIKRFGSYCMVSVHICI